MLEGEASCPSPGPGNARPGASPGRRLLATHGAASGPKICCGEAEILARLVRVPQRVSFAPMRNTFLPNTLALKGSLLCLFLLSSCVVEGHARHDLFNGENLNGWHTDVPSADDNPEVDPSFAVQDGVLMSLGNPNGHLITDRSFKNYTLEVEYRWTGEPGNCGVLVHASTPRRLYGMFPSSIEVQMHRGNAGDFWCIGEDIWVDNMVERRGKAENWGVEEGKARRIRNLTDDSENPAGEWNHMRIECKDDRVDVWVNGDLVNQGYACTATEGQIALQAEGAPCAFRLVVLTEHF